MSTKKNNIAPRQGYDQTIKPNEKKSLKKIAKQVAAEHENCPKPTLLVKKSDLKKVEPQVEKKDRFHIWDVYGVKFFMDENNIPTRRVSMIEVTSDHDTANEPALRNQLIEEAEDELINKGFFMTDVDAMESALKETEPVLDSLRHDIKYGETCQKCASGRIGELLDWLEYLRGWRDRRFALADALGGTHNLPPIIPNDYQENWHIDEEKHALVPNVKKPKAVHTIEISNVKDIKDLPKIIEKLELPKEASEKLNTIVKKLIDNKTNDQKKLPDNKNKPKK